MGIVSIKSKIIIKNTLLLLIFILYFKFALDRALALYSE